MGAKHKGRTYADAAKKRADNQHDKAETPKKHGHTKPAAADAPADGDSLQTPADLKRDLPRPPCPAVLEV